MRRKIVHHLLATAAILPNPANAAFLPSTVSFCSSKHRAAFSSSSSSSSSAGSSDGTNNKGRQPLSISTVERLKLLRAIAREEEEGQEDAPAAAAGGGGGDEAAATVMAWLQKLVIGQKLCPWAAPALNAKAIKILIHPQEQSLEALVEMTVKEATFLAHMSEEPQARNRTTLIGVPGSLLADFSDFLDLTELVDECIDDMDLRGKVQLATFHPDYVFADSEETEVENYTNRSPMPVLHLLREIEISRALEQFQGDPARIYERNKAVMRDMGAKQLRALIESCKAPAAEK